MMTPIEVAEIIQELSNAEKGGQNTLAKYLTEVDEDKLTEAMEHAIVMCVTIGAYSKIPVIQRKLEIFHHIRQGMREGQMLVVSEGTALQSFQVSQN